MDSLNLQDYNILLVDDDVAYTESKSIRLEAKGLNISVINNPEEALEYVKDNLVDVILLDFFMPQMTGEEFLVKLREFNKEIVVILQTGYAGDKPQDEMLKELNIQGYYDKTEPFETLMLMVLSAIKSVKLLREIKRNAEEKHIRNLKDEFFANKINAISGEINGKLMNIGGPAMILEDWTNENIPEEEKREFIIKRVSYLKDAAEQIKNAVRALNIASEKESTPKNMLEKINELLKIELMSKCSKLIIEPLEDYSIINMELGNLPYLICKDIENRLDAGNKEIRINTYKEENNVIIKISSEWGMKENEKLLLEKVAEFCEMTRIKVGENETMVIIDKVKE